MPSNAFIQYVHIYIFKPPVDVILGFFFWYYSNADYKLACWLNPFFLVIFTWFICVLIQFTRLHQIVVLLLHVFIPSKKQFLSDSFIQD